ncbi:hypothetical protein SAMN05444671_1187 [Flavobacterium sp. CF108]|uniref:hypothetical protein n=1 Tax=unclassified Flavobacterium TaxID=196869 RepID=UPI0008BDE6F3|nr:MULTISPECIES: hypothetical protein [unclassified Flavobacterium]SEO86673.1 hypothetical protein SAMN04487978_3866 [Flavobacterium sp. fv08]SHG68676.1 hypothetical protein SAMN05444671_1187 [Flavobacterium sp. CF108]
MKKYVSLLILALLLNGCDDGDLTVDTIDFADVQTSASCPNSSTDETAPTLIYKLKTQESLVIQMPANSIKTDATPVGTPLTYDIDNSTYRVLYRAYDGTVAINNICGTIPPRTPNVTEEWQATAGIIEVTSTQVTGDKSATDGSTRITGYNHQIVFRNITFLKPAGPQTEEEFVFGNYTTAADPINLTFTTVPTQCTDKKQVFNFNPTSYMQVNNLDQNLIQQVVGTRSSAITAAANNITYTTFKSNTGTLTSSYFCISPAPSAPAVSTVWNSVVDNNGIVEVTTTATGTTSIVYKHTITIKNVTLKKGNSSFYLADNFVLGTITDAPVTAPTAKK